MKKKSPILTIFLTVFVDMLGVGVLIPVMPLLLGDPTSPYNLLPAGWSIEQGYILLGLLTAVFPLMQFFATPILGQLSDKYGRKDVLLLSLFGTGLSYVMFAYGIMTRNLPLLFVSRAFDGITGGNISVAQAAIADISSAENRAKNFGMIGMAFGLGFIFGPFLGGKLSDPTVQWWFDAATPFWFAALLACLNGLSVGAFFPETLANPQRGMKIHWLRSLNNIKNAYDLKKIRHLFLTAFLFNGGFSFFTTFFGVYLISKFAYTQGQIGDFFAVVGFCIALSQAVVVRRAAKIFKQDQILRVSLIGTGIMIFLHIVPSAAWQLFLITPFFAMFNGLSHANLNALISRSAGPEEQGRIMGINTGIQALAQAIPPIISGFVAASMAPGSSIMVSAILIVIGGISFNLLHKKHETV
jgi:DHA1 family tetracycline resistance protein-like MFS transporter